MRRFHLITLCSWWWASIASIAFGGACQPDPPPRPRAARDAARVAPRPTPRQQMATVRLTIVVPPRREVTRLEHLPPFPKFQDPTRLPRRSIKRERHLAWRSRGHKRQLILTHLATRLWIMANLKIDKVRQLERTADQGGQPIPRDQIAKLKREASSHLQECVTLLEGVLESGRAPATARIKLAHYLRRLKPTAAIPLFERLIKDAAISSQRRAYTVDLAQLLIRQGQFQKAARLLDTPETAAGNARVRLLSALASRHAYPAKSVSASRIGPLLSGCDSFPDGLKRSLRHNLPDLLAGLVKPATALTQLARHSRGCWSGFGKELVSRLLEALLLSGRPDAARRVLSVARLKAYSPTADLRGRIRRLAGPWQTEPHPPTQLRWQTLVQARVAAIQTCLETAGRPALPWRITLRIQPSGRVTRIATQPLRRAPPRVSKPKRSAPRSIQRCLQRQASQWLFVPWQASKAMNLVITLEAGAPPG